MSGLTAPPHPREADRLAALHRHRILDTAREERFDRISRIAVKLFGTKIALVSLVDENRQWFKSRIGLDTAETSRALSFCAHAILDDRPLVIPDALADPRFRDNDLVTGPPHIRFYAGAQIVTSDGYPLGTLCIIDDAPRPPLGADDLATLRDLADLAAVEIERLGTAKDAFSKSLARQDRVEATSIDVESLVILVETTPAPLLMLDDGGRIVAATAQWRDLFGLAGAPLIGRTLDTAMTEYAELWRDRLAGVMADGQVIVAAPDLDARERAAGLKGWHGVPWHCQDGSVGGAVVLAGGDEGLLGRAGWFHEHDKMAALGRLAVGMSHDVANLLSVLSGTFELLRLELSDVKNADLLEALESVIRRGRDLTRRLGGLATDNVRVPSPIRVGAQISSLVEVIRPTLPRSLTLDLSLGEDLPPVAVLPGRFDAALLNLIANARDAMDGRPGTIRIVAPVSRRRSGKPPARGSKSVSRTRAAACRPVSGSGCSNPSSRPSRRIRGPGWG